MKSFLAILAGLIAWPALFLTSYQGLMAVFAEHFEEDGGLFWAPLLIGLLALSVVVSYATGWITAAVAPAASRVKLATIVGLINLAFGIFAQSSGWELAPVWYHLPFLALLLPAHWLGGVAKAKGSASG